MYIIFVTPRTVVDVLFCPVDSLRNTFFYYYLRIAKMIHSIIGLRNQTFEFEFKDSVPILIM